MDVDIDIDSDSDNETALNTIANASDFSSAGNRLRVTGELEHHHHQSRSRRESDQINFRMEDHSVEYSYGITQDPITWGDSSDEDEGVDLPSYIQPNPRKRSGIGVDSDSDSDSLSEYVPGSTEEEAMIKKLLDISARFVDGDGRATTHSQFTGMTAPDADLDPIRERLAPKSKPKSKQATEDGDVDMRGSSGAWNAVSEAVEDYSDEEGEGENDGDDEAKVKVRVKVYPKPAYLTDDQILLDSTDDGGNQRYVDGLRREYLFSEGKKDGLKEKEKGKHRSDDENENKEQELPKSDAILSCPCCFTVLCYDCQRHEGYANQYRAMFVRNCDVKKERLRNVQDGKEEVYRPVMCSICSTEVAVLDSSDVYHFFDVFPSY